MVHLTSVLMALSLSAVAQDPVDPNPIFAAAFKFGIETMSEYLAATTNDPDLERVRILVVRDRVKVAGEEERHSGRFLPPDTAELGRLPGLAGTGLQAEIIRCGPDIDPTRANASPPACRVEEADLALAATVTRVGEGNAEVWLHYSFNMKWGEGIWVEHGRSELLLLKYEEGAWTVEKSLNTLTWGD
jgi:hypothetical protein